MRQKALLLLVVVVTLLGLGHQVDHVIRGNHVGWPFTDEVNAFTYSFVFYPAVLAGIYLFERRRVGPRYWLYLAVAGVVFVTTFHFGPFPEEPPADIIGVYDSPALGWTAFGLLLAFTAVLVVTALYSWKLSRRE